MPEIKKILSKEITTNLTKQETVGPKVLFDYWSNITILMDLVVNITLFN